MEAASCPPQDREGATCDGPVLSESARPFGRLVHRADFLRVASGRRWHGRALTLQAHHRGDDEAAVRLGFTLTKKVGCAVVRNRARRRLREAARLCRDLAAKEGHDYVVIGRIDAVRLSFEDLQGEMRRAFAAVHTAKRRQPAESSRIAAGSAEIRRPSTGRPSQRRGAKRISPEP